MNKAILGVLLSVNMFAISQVDDSLNTLSLSNFPHFTDTIIQSGDFEIDNSKQKGKDRIILFKTLYIQKHQGVWLYDSDSCSIKHLKASKMAYFSSGTQAVYCGLSWDAGVKNRKSLRSVSYPIRRNLSVGDTLEFKLTILADRGSKFQPEVYTSKKVKGRRGMLKTGKYLNFLGQVPKASSGDTNLVENNLVIHITKENEDIKWVHIVNYEDERQRGFIIESDYNLGGTIDDDYARVYFGNDSYRLNKKGITLLDEIIADLKKSNAIVLRGYSDPSGQKDYNIRLARNRAQAVMNYLIKKGVDESRVKIEEFDIGKNKLAKENRICTILVL